VHVVLVMRVRELLRPLVADLGQHNGRQARRAGRRRYRVLSEDRAAISNTGAA
jgi:hypothetical protein